MRYIVLCIAFLVTCALFSINGVAGIVPVRELSITSSLEPEWKKTWDLGRSHVREGNFSAAARQYQKLLEERPDISQAKWEYSQVAYYIGNTAISSTLLSDLLEKNPDKIDLVLFAARVSFAQTHYKTATKYYQHVYDKTPFSEEGLEALKGLVVSLLKQNKKEEALPLMRQLTARTDNNMTIIRELALVTSSLGLLEESENYYQELLSKNMISAEDALDASHVFEGEEKYSELNRNLKEEYLASFSGDLLVRKKLGESYLESGLQEKAVEHLIIIAESGQTVEWLRAANIYEYTLNRQDKAIYCYEQYSQLNPDNKYIKNKISNLQEQIALELMVLVETVDAERLWKDLDQVIDSPDVVYLKMFHEAKSKGDQDLALKLLNIIEVNEGQKNKLKLADLYIELGEEARSYNLLKQTPKELRDILFYQKKINLEKKLGFSYEEYNSRFSLFLLDPARTKDILYLIDKSVNYGIISNIDRLYEFANVRRVLEKDDERAKNVLHSYADSGYFAKAFNIVEKLPITSNEKKKIKAELLTKRGLPFEAEQLYRQLLVKDSELESFVIDQLVDLDLGNKNIDHAKLWHDQFIEKRDRYRLSELDQNVLNLIQAKILIEEENYSDAQFLLETVYEKIKEDIGASIVRKTVTVLSDVLYRQGKFKECVELSKNTGIKTATLYLSKQQFKDSKIDDDQLLAVSEYLYSRREYESVKDQLETLLSRVPESTVAIKYYAETLVALGILDEALTQYQKLIKYTGESAYHSLRIADIYGSLEQNERELSILVDNDLTAKNSPNLKDTFSDPLKNERALKVSRALWRAGQKEESLALYSKTLDSLKGSLEDIAALEANHTDENKGYWKELTSIFYPDRPVRDKIMEPGFLLTFHDTEEIHVLNDLYSQYRWHRLIKHEYEARNATYQKKLFLAEKNYRKLFEEEGSSETMMDLATIYKRLGYYAHEARVYQTVKESGVAVAELEESIQVNEQKRKPQLALEMDFSNRDGRDGVIDMLKYQYGTSFWFMPNLNTDLFVKYLRTNYEDDLFDKESNYIGVGGQYNFNDNTSLYIDFGAEDLSGTNDLKFLSKVKLDHRVNENIKSYVLYNKRRVDDNIQAVEEQIFAEDFEGGLSFETEFGLEIGGDYRYTFLNGDNEQDRVHGYLFYNIFGDTTRLDFHYDFEYLYSDQSTESVSYWSPQDYRIHELSLYFEHQFSYLDPSEELESFYSFEYAIGFEDDQNIRYTGQFDIFLEMSEHYLLKGSVLYSRSDDYDESEARLLFVYRW